MYKVWLTVRQECAWPACVAPDRFGWKRSPCASEDPEGCRRTSHHRIRWRTRLYAHLWDVPVWGHISTTQLGRMIMRDWGKWLWMIGGVNDFEWLGRMIMNNWGEWLWMIGANDYKWFGQMIVNDWGEWLWMIVNDLGKWLWMIGANDWGEWLGWMIMFDWGKW